MYLCCILTVVCVWCRLSCVSATVFLLLSCSVQETAYFFSGTCAPGWKESGKRCYRFMGGALPYFEALKFCEVSTSIPPSPLFLCEKIIPRYCIIFIMRDVFCMPCVHCGKCRSHSLFVQPVNDYFSFEMPHME